MDQAARSTGLFLWIGTLNLHPMPPSIMMPVAAAVAYRSQPSSLPTTSLLLGTLPREVAVLPSSPTMLSNSLPQATTGPPSSNTIGPKPQPPFIAPSSPSPPTLFPSPPPSSSLFPTPIEPSLHHHHCCLHAQAQAIGEPIWSSTQAITLPPSSSLKLMPPPPPPRCRPDPVSTMGTAPIDSHRSLLSCPATRAPLSDHGTADRRPPPLSLSPPLRHRRPHAHCLAATLPSHLHGCTPRSYSLLPLPRCRPTFLLPPSLLLPTMTLSLLPPLPNLQTVGCCAPPSLPPSSPCRSSSPSLATHLRHHPPSSSPVHHGSHPKLLCPSSPSFLLCPKLQPTGRHSSSPFLLPITTISTFALLLSSSAHCSEPQAIRPPSLFFSRTDHCCSSPPMAMTCHQANPSFWHPSTTIQHAIFSSCGRSPRSPRNLRVQEVQEFQSNFNDPWHPYPNYPK